MDERSVVLLTKIVLLLILFPLCQYGSELKLGSFALSQPADEEKAFQNFSTVLGITDMPKLFCHDKLLSRSINISCVIITNEWHIQAIIKESKRLTGKISASVSSLKYLEKLDLSNNELGGSIPEELGMLPNLHILDLSGNQLTGRIPLTLGNLKNLTELYLDLNFLHETIPPSLGSLSSLEVLSLWSNQLSGNIPYELGNLSKLLYLDLSDNGLNDSLPAQLGNLSNLEVLWLTSNNLIGTLPNDYKKFTNLQIFDIGGNKFSGSIPEYIANWVKLRSLNLMGNNFNGTPPPGIFKMTSLQNLFISDLNNSGFPFPESANLESIYSLTLRKCNIIGKIPPYIANWNTTLYHLDLSFNNLTDGVPDQFKNLKLYSLLLKGNNLSEPFPEWIYGIVQTSGDLSYNDFTFRDDQLNNLTNSLNRTINIEPRQESFTKENMDKYCPHKKSKHYSLFINSGGEKITIGKDHYEADTSTSRFYVSETHKWAYTCNGDFFATPTNSSDFRKNAACAVSLNTAEAPLLANARLCPHSLTYYGFCFYNGDYAVKLYFSEIVYAEKEDHSSSGTRLFDIYIQGKPERKDFNIKESAKWGPNNESSIDFTAYVGDHLLEIELYWAGKGSVYNPPFLHGPLISAISVTPKFKVGLSTWEVVGIVIGCVSILLLSLALLLALSWRLGWLGDRELRVNTVELNGKPYTLKQVKDATRNFSSDNVIGKGRFGTVYKAELPEKTTVAVKMLSPQSKQEIGQIGAEVYALKQLDENDNVVKLFDCYSGKDLHLLIYEYMEKGSLQHTLFGPNSDVQLDWPTRIRICRGIAKGLKYLHEDKKSCKVVHRNIKPSNVLLDRNLNAKVADFGLAKLYDEENPYKFIQEKGTAVYMAPEYAMRKAITDKVDVYSFGIVLLEIVSGQANAKYDENQETVFLLDRLIVLHERESLFDLVDTKMSIDRDGREQAIEVLKLAMKCVNQSPTLRPTMSEVVCELEKISNIITRSG